MSADALTNIVLAVSVVAFALALSTALMHWNRRKVRHDVEDWNSRPEVLRGDQPRIDDNV